MLKRLRQLTFPREHGAWGMLAEPMLAGLIAAFSWSGVALCVAALLAFLGRRAVMLGWLVRSMRADPAGRRAARTLGLVLFLLSGAVAAGALRAAAAPGEAAVVLVAAAACAVGQGFIERPGRGRSVWAQQLGALALTCIGPLAVLVGDGRPGAAIKLGLLLAMRQVLVIRFVRLKLRTMRGQERGGDRRGLLVHALVAGAVFACLVNFGAAGATASVGFGLLIVRYAIGLARLGRPVAPKRLGLLELAIGVAYAALVGMDNLQVLSVRT